jgi:hypothetical protein
MHRSGFESDGDSGQSQGDGRLIPSGTAFPCGPVAVTVKRRLWITPMGFVGGAQSPWWGGCVAPRLLQQTTTSQVAKPAHTSHFWRRDNGPQCV